MKYKYKYYTKVASCNSEQRETIVVPMCQGNWERYKIRDSREKKQRVERRNRSK